ncbi:glycoside hydrolase family 28 protein [Geofilum rubicundum]|nr:glycoside hydrolase family 28 protein [Geofilum rubicundum]
MNNFSFLILLMVMTGLFSACGPKTSPVTHQSIAVEAPFDMPEITVPDFSACVRLDITEFGARANDLEATTAAIAQAMEQASAAGGGVVVVPAGEWPTKAIHFRSHVNLHLEADAVLLFSGQPEHYLPSVHTTWEGMECYNYSPLIYAYECENVAITGSGKLKAEMAVWEQWFPRPEPHMAALKELYHMAAQGVPVEERQMVGNDANLRPHFIQFNRCKNVLLEDVSIENSPFWVIHPYLSSDVVIRGVHVLAHGHNNDGVDPEMSQNMLIEDCVFDQGDDAIAVKSGRNQDAWRLNTPTKNLVVRNCLIKNGHQLLAIGSELSGGVENVFMDNCIVEEGAKMFHLVFIKTNERRGGYVKNIFVHNVKAGDIRDGVLGIETDVLYQWRDLVPTYERRLTTISDVVLTNIQIGDVQFVSRILGEEEMPVKDIRLENVTYGALSQEAHIHKNVEGFEAL